MTLSIQQSGLVRTLQERIAAAPQDARNYQQLADAYQSWGRPSEAMPLRQAAARLAPNDVVQQMALAIALQNAGELRTAIQQYQRVLTLAPRHAQAHLNLALMLQNHGDFRGSLPHFQALVSLSPRDPALLKMLGHAALRAHDYPLAESALRSALELATDDAETLTYLGAALNFLRKGDEALQRMRQAITLSPNSLNTRFTLAETLLRLGHYAEGFAWYERALELERQPAVQAIRSRLSLIPAWQEQALTGEHLLVWQDQGHGDAIMFVRYCHLLRDRGLKALTLLVDPSLASLFRSSLPEATILTTRAPELASGIIGPSLHCSFSALPSRLFNPEQAIPNQTPYLSAGTEEGKPFPGLSRIPANSLKVGLCWAGSPDTPLDHLRSIPASLFAPLGRLRHVALVSLQHGPASTQRTSAGFSMLDETAGLKDFLDTAKLVMQLDLVITVDTAIAHLAGALNKPVWLLNRYESEWRWQADREDSPWYPSLRIFNQSRQGQWKPVINAVRQELELLAYRHARAQR